jgi:hypothetical protein
VTDAAAIVALRRISLYLSDSGHPDAAWFSAALQEYEAGARFGIAFDHTLGLRPGIGQTSWWEAEAIDKRDDLIRIIAARHFPGISRRSAADAIIREAKRYETTAWRSHRAYWSAPDSLIGTLRAHLFDLMKLGLPITRRVAERALMRHETPPIHGSRVAAR